ncbi:GPR1/FUN34/yaaH family-domain-containing protein [Fusarium solani]|uniref:GPR1/FUN34/yaaH family-domain-containing protein n=1 Tax=Fusarium solani TaxID=169388 RepID=A0A9P9GHB6_FUSSL|nr:GPR1/FUN34/yaaH family-domain-containing protein [Fusarium solani]KAH7237999.1 GPR1/FUN34/yaaH family-domain-containing protein [Fusarium solani]
MGIVKCRYSQSHASHAPPAPPSLEPNLLTAALYTMEKHNTSEREDIVSIPRMVNTSESAFRSPKNIREKGLPRTFGNPTPIALGGFIMCTTPLSMVLLGWQGAGGLGAANVGTYFYLGGLLLLLGGIGEWILGNTFPAVVFSQFGGFWFTYGATLVPGYGAYSAYAVHTNNPAEGLKEPEFFATFAFFLVAMALLCIVFLVASLRTNIVFFLIFLLLVPTFSCLAASFFHLAQGNVAHAATLQNVGAALLLAVSLLAWYIFTALVLQSVEFPYVIPVGDMPCFVKGGRKERNGGNGGAP